MGKYYVFHDWENLKNSWDNRKKFNDYVERIKWDNILLYICLVIFGYFFYKYIIVWLIIGGGIW
jgi:hypothetical protein